MVCDVCGKEFKGGAGLAAHKRKGHDPVMVPEPTVETESLEAMPPSDIVEESAPSEVVVLCEMKGFKAVTEGGGHYVYDRLGRRLGSFETPLDAKKFVENSNRWIR